MRDYTTVSLPKVICESIDELVEELRFWLSRSALVWEACLEKIRRERKELGQKRTVQEVPS